MNDTSKILLSADELATLKDRAFFERKWQINEKIYHQFAEIIMRSHAKRIFQGINFPPGTDFLNGKISKGENYLGLPYLLLDFPRNFRTEQLLAVRTMIWWGNFISCTLLIGGNALPAMRQVIVGQKSNLIKAEISICVNESPWHHHFQKSNYRPLHEYSRIALTNLMQTQSFVKISRKLSLRSINRLEPFVLESFGSYAAILKRVFNG